MSFSPGSAELIAFTHVPKTAGTTLHHILRRTYGMRYVVVAPADALGPSLTPAGLRRIRRRYPRLAGLGGHPVLPTSDLEQVDSGMRFMTMLREPAPRCASHYAHERMRGTTSLPFVEWVARPRMRNAQTQRFSAEQDAATAISVLEEKYFFVGLVEEFDASLRLLASDVPGLALPVGEERRNPSRAADIKTGVLADPDALAAVERSQAEDLKLYDHVKGTLWSQRLGGAETAARSQVSERRAARRAKLSLAKERIVLGIPRRLTRSRAGDRRR